MIVLALNCGSTSLKFSLMDVPRSSRPRRLAGGAVERFGDDALVTLRIGDDPAQRSAEPIRDHAVAAQRVIHWVGTTPGRPVVDAVGHRVVHGGQHLIASTLIDDGVVTALEALTPLAPLHNAPGLAGIRASRRILGAVPMVAVFDTAFHATLPEHAAAYAIPREMALRHAVRRYGFHGIAYRSMLACFAEATGIRPEQARIVAFHLGGGASAAAIDRGRSVDTSMGFTPLEGLVMATRSGDLDPALVPYLAAREEMTADEVVGWLNEHSGLLGVSGISGDMRELLDQEAHDAQARLAVDIYCYRARKYLGAYLAALGGADAVVFSGGVGEHAPAVRARICAGFDWCGLVLDAERNTRTLGQVGRISAVGAMTAWVIPTDEESVIAADVVTCVERDATHPRSPA